MSFEWQREVVNSHITPMLNRVMYKFSFSNSPHQVAVVIDKSTPETLKTELTHYLQSINSKARIKYYDYSALKYSKGKNGIKEPNVIVLQYRPHYIRESYAKYPNSFDPYFVNKGQYIFDLIQGFVFNDMYAWDKYDYDMVMHDLMSCDYRDDVLGEYETPTKPTIKRVIGEAEFSDERTGKSVTVYVKGRFDNGQAFSIPETDFVNTAAGIIPAALSKESSASSIRSSISSHIFSGKCNKSRQETRLHSHSKVSLQSSFFRDFFTASYCRKGPKNNHTAGAASEQAGIQFNAKLPFSCII